MLKEVLGIESIRDVFKHNPVVACLFVGLGIYFPIVRTTTGYTWNIVDIGAWLSFVAVGLALLAHFFHNQLPEQLGNKLLRLGAWLLVGVFCFGLYQANEGWSFFNYQTAIDMPGWEAVSKDEYWSKLYSLLGLKLGTSSFTDLRMAYEAFGSGVTLNGSQVFVDKINSLPLSSIRELTSLHGASVVMIPDGLVMMLAGVIIYIKSAYQRIKAGNLNSNISV